MIKNLLTGDSTVLSTAAVPPEELIQHTGLKVYDDGRKCVYALNSQEVLSFTIIIIITIIIITFICVASLSLACLV